MSPGPPFSVSPRCGCAFGSVRLRMTACSDSCSWAFSSMAFLARAAIEGLGFGVQAWGSKVFSVEIDGMGVQVCPGFKEWHTE
jgi:hypothetical protein